MILYALTDGAGHSIDDSGVIWSLPRKGDPGEWITAEHESGFLLRPPNRLLEALGAEVFVAEWKGEHAKTSKGIRVQRARLMRHLSSWNSGARRRCLAECLARILPVYDSRSGGGELQNALASARLLAEGSLSEEELTSVHADLVSKSKSLRQLVDDDARSHLLSQLEAGDDHECIEDAAMANSLVRCLALSAASVLMGAGISRQAPAIARLAARIIACDAAPDHANRAWINADAAGRDPLKELASQAPEWVNAYRAERSWQRDSIGKVISELTLRDASDEKVSIECPGCEKTLVAKSSYVGRTVRCKHCQTKFEARAASAAQQTSPAIERDRLARSDEPSEQSTEERTPLPPEMLMTTCNTLVEDVRTSTTEVSGASPEPAPSGHAADAKHWQETGQVPLRSTPMEDELPSDPEDSARQEHRNVRSIPECRKDLLARVKAAEKEMVKEKHNAVCQGMMRAIQELKPMETMVSDTLQALHERHKRSIEAVLFELTEHDCPEAVRAIRPFLSHNMDLIRRLAMEALSKMSDPSAGKALSKLVSFFSFASAEDKDFARALLKNSLVKRSQTDKSTTGSPKKSRSVAMGLKYFECDVPSGDGLCSDNACPCDDTVIPKGTGYLFIEQNLVDFRRQYPKLEDARRAKRAEAEQLHEQLGLGLFANVTYRLGPILVCEEGARKRNLDLDVAGADARHWWETGQVPLRATPRARDAASARRVGRDAGVDTDFLKSVKVTSQCIAGLNDNNVGVVVIRVSTVEEFLKSATDYSGAPERAAAIAAAQMGLVACRGSISSDELVVAAAAMTSDPLRFEVAQHQSAADILNNVPDEWKVPVYRVMFA